MIQAIVLSNLAKYLNIHIWSYCIDRWKKYGLPVYFQDYDQAIATLNRCQGLFGSILLGW